MKGLFGLFHDLSLCVGPRHRARLLALYAMMILSAMLEALCAGMFVPFTAMLADPAYLEDYKGFDAFFAFAHADTLPQRLIAYSALMCLAFLIKNLYGAFFVYYKSSFIRLCHATLAQDLLNVYIRKDYLYHVQRNSAEIIRNVNQDVTSIYANVLPSILNILVDGLMAGALLALMLWSTPWEGTIAMALFVVLCVGFYKFTQRKNIQLGAEQRQFSGEMFKWSIQGLGAIKETKVMNKEDYFLSMFEEQMRGYSRAAASYGLIRELPKLFIEVAGIVVMLLITIILVYRADNYTVVLPTLSLFAVSTFRMLPALNRLATAFSSIRFHRATLYNICEDLRAGPEHVSLTAPTMAPMEERVELRDVYFCYPGNESPVLRGLSLQVKRGETVALVGNSGAGKTTLVDIILGLLKPSAGAVLIDDQPMPEQPAAWQRQIGYISQPIYLLDDTVRRNVAFGLHDDEIDDERVWAALAKAQLEDVVRAMAQGLETRLGEVGVRLSGGQRQRIGIARVLYRDPAILIFDEATSALDSVTEQEITNAIARLHGEKTIILIAHRFSTVRGCDRIFMLSDGVVEGEGDFETLLRTNTRFRHMVELHDRESAASSLTPDKRS